MKIGMLGAPGVGKSTLASGIFYHMKLQRKRVELIAELVKYKAYKDLDFSADGFDILNTLEQKEFESLFEESSDKLDYLICEAPLCNGYFYSSFYNKKLELPVLQQIAKNYFPTYDLILFVVHDLEHEYLQFGRKETYEQSILFERHIKEKISEFSECKNTIIFLEYQTPIDEILDLIEKVKTGEKLAPIPGGNWGYIYENLPSKTALATSEKLYIN